MRVVYPVCCGVDVHKSVIVATIAPTDPKGITSYEQRSFKTLNPDLKTFRNWLAERDCRQVCMESTGKYWIPLSNVLEEHVRVVLVHPKYVRAIKGKKTDKIIASACDRNIGSDQRFKLNQAMGHMDCLDEMVARCELEPLVRMLPYCELVKPIAEMPGVTELSTVLILSEIGADDARLHVSYDRERRELQLLRSQGAEEPKARTADRGISLEVPRIEGLRCVETRAAGVMLCDSQGAEPRILPGLSSFGASFSMNLT